ncbi:hypothetical protein [Natronosalvus rutilus]|uniref:Uncharacterized protein n=1 Tax=Natronosalvus rutilus TaxID=2953753 RepID=A0A9E7NEF2_9EURY|nr:hypothetical protein [Natronosalvus rutilus]UTF55966.1 hypothetical protein NGM29_20965 [Natronosalvus rutilus]
MNVSLTEHRLENLHTAAILTAFGVIGVGFVGVLNHMIGIPVIAVCLLVIGYTTLKLAEFED